MLLRLLNLEYKPIEAVDITLHENKMIKAVVEIETRIFEKIFAYLKPNKDLIEKVEEEKVEEEEE